MTKIRETLKKRVALLVGLPARPPRATLVEKILKRLLGFSDCRVWVALSVPFGDVAAGLGRTVLAARALTSLCHGVHPLSVLVGVGSFISDIHTLKHTYPEFGEQNLRLAPHKPFSHSEHVFDQGGLV